MIRSIVIVLAASVLPLAPASAADVIPQLESADVGFSKVAEDPGAFNMPWSARQTYRRTRTGAMEETACADNNIAFDASVSEIPKAEKPDF